MNIKASLQQDSTDSRGLEGTLTSPQVDENAEPTAYSTRFLQAVAKAGYPLLAICSTASRSQTYKRQSV